MLAQLEELSNLSDTELATKIKENDQVSGCIAELQNRHSGIFHQKAAGYTGSMEVRDLVDNPMTFFWEVAKTYDPSKSKFNTWLGKNTFWACHGYMKDSRNDKEIEEWDASEFPSLGRDEIYDYVQEHIEDEDDKNILTYWLDGYKLKEIEEKMGGKYSYEWCRQRKNRVLERFRKILMEEIK